MLEWIREALGFPVSLENVARLPGSFLEPLTQDLARLKRLDPTLPARALSFVVDGLDGNLPSAISQANPRNQMWTSHDQDKPQRAHRWKLYDQWDAAPAEVWIRFGWILAATSSPIIQNPALTIGTKHPWVEALATDLVGLPLSHYGKPQTVQKPHAAATMDHLEALLQADGIEKYALTVSAFTSFPKLRGRTAIFARAGEFISLIAGFEASAVRDADRVRGSFRDPIFDNRVYLLRLIANFSSAGLAEFSEELVALALDSSTQVRAAAVPLALKAGFRALNIAQQCALDRKPEQRAQALTLLWASGIETFRAFVKERGASDPAESVRRAVQSLIDASAPPTPPPEPVEIKLDLERPLTKDAADALRTCFALHNELTRQQRDRAEEKWKKNWTELTGAQIDSIIEQVAKHPPDGHVRINSSRSWMVWHKLFGVLGKWARREDVALAHVVRLGITCGWTAQGNGSFWGPATMMLSQFGRSPGRASLLELEKLLQVYGLPAELLANDWFRTWRGRVTDGWPSEAVAPYFLAHRELIEGALNPAGPMRNDYAHNYCRVYDALATLPSVPTDLLPRLLDLALGTNKTDRAGAQRVLDRLPGIEERIVQALNSGKAEVRATAATWLARLNASDATEPLEAALKKEKNDVAAGAMMSALEKFGVPVDRFLNRAGLVKEAQAGLKKGLPADLSWFPFDQLPVLEWQDTGERIPPEVARWWIVQSYRLKNPEPGGVLRHYFAALRPARREAFATFVLQSWIRADVTPIARAEAEKLARAQARQTIAIMKAYPQGYSDEQKKLTEDQVYEAQLPSCLARPAGSAIGAKGLLAAVAAGGGPEIAPLAHRYIKEWYGTRAAQGKALIQMLAWVDHPTATQLMLSIGSRFRTKGFQEEATRQAERLAERRGWTVDELADRTIPTAGFDRDGTTVIDYGARQFQARLGADLEVQLYSPEGKEISYLPDARKDEDESRVKEAKKAWSNARKELKGVLQLQRDRLYEALCTERTWSYEDWQLYLQQHPIVGRYCQRLVWSSTDESGAGTVRTFRPLDDGTLTGLEDEAVELSPRARISLAHDSNLSPELAQRWQQHLVDYKVEPLFQQFGKGVYQLPNDRREQTELEDFLGHVLDAYSLRGRANKLGYTRGAAEDGGWFFRYEKRFPTLAIEAQVEFTGNSLPETNRKVALRSLSFKARTGDNEQTMLVLGDVPKVLLSECWNDLRLMAAEGSGFDPDWEKKTGS